jgi:hypothetical protein
MISSTTVSAGEREGSNSAYATAKSRGSLMFFIRALSKRSLENGQDPREIVFLFYAARSIEANWAGLPTGLILAG